MKKSPKEIICNYCGESCNVMIDEDNAGLIRVENGGLIKAKVIGGYFSTPGNGNGALDDFTSYEFSLCEFCLDNMFSEFIIPPYTNDINIDGSILKTLDFEPAHSRALKYKNKKYINYFIKQSEKRKNGREKRKKLKPFK